MRCIHPENSGVSPSHLTASCTPEGVSKELMKVAFILFWFRVKCLEFLLFLSIISFTNIYKSQDRRRKGQGISLTIHYHFHLLHKHLDSNWAITAESSPLYIKVNREPLVSECKLLTTKLHTLGISSN